MGMKHGDIYREMASVANMHWLAPFLFPRHLSLSFAYPILKMLNKNHTKNLSCNISVKLEKRKKRYLYRKRSISIKNFSVAPKKGGI